MLKPLPIMLLMEASKKSTAATALILLNYLKDGYQLTLCTLLYIITAIVFKICLGMGPVINIQEQECVVEKPLFFVLRQLAQPIIIGVILKTD